MKQVFCLRWADYDCSSEFYFIAPEGATEENFKKLCDSLLKEAAHEACNHKGYTWGGIPEDLEDRNETWVGWANLVHVLAYVILPKHGYERIDLPSVTYVGTTIINDSEYGDKDKLLEQEALDIIIQHNKRVEASLNKHQKQLQKSATVQE